MHFCKYLSVALFLLTTLCGQAQETGSVQVATSAPNNRTVTVYYRVPKGYDTKRLDSYRVLFIFGGRNTTGKADATGRLGWGEWASMSHNAASGRTNKKNKPKVQKCH